MLTTKKKNNYFFWIKYEEYDAIEARDCVLLTSLSFLCSDLYFNVFLSFGVSILYILQRNKNSFDYGVTNYCSKFERQHFNIN